MQQRNVFMKTYFNTDDDIDNNRIIIDDVHNKKYTYEELNEVQGYYKDATLYLIVGADNLAELELMCEKAKETKRDNIKIGIRVNINVGQDFVSRFGIHENDLEKAFLLAQKYGVKIAGLHCHISRARGLDAWIERTESLLRISDRFMPEGPDFIDLGSGM